MFSSDACLQKKHTHTSNLLHVRTAWGRGAPLAELGSAQSPVLSKELLLATVAKGLLLGSCAYTSCEAFF